MDHVDPELVAGLVLDPAESDESVRAHVATCPECSALCEELERTLGLVREAGEEEPLVSPAPRVRDRLRAEIQADPGTADAPVVPVTPTTGRRPGRLWGWAAAVAAAVVLAFGLGRLTAPSDEAPPEGPGQESSVVAQARLTTVEGRGDRGRALAVRREGRLALEVAARGLGEAPSLREVWLLNVDGKRMVSVGFLAAGHDGTFEVPSGLLDRGYRIVDISIEPDDGDPTHSGVSVARGELT